MTRGENVDQMQSRYLLTSVCRSCLKSMSSSLRYVLSRDDVIYLKMTPSLEMSSLEICPL